MLNGPFIERNRPIRVIPSNRRRYVKTVWQLHIDRYIRIGIKISGKIAFIGGIIHNMVIQMSLRFHGVCAELSFDGWLCKYVRIIPFIQHIVGNMLDNCRCLFIVD